MSNAMSRSKSRWKAGLLAGAAMAVISPLAANAQSMSVSILANPLGSGASSNKYLGSNNVYIDPYDTDTLYVYATVTGTAAPSASYVDGLEYLYFNVNAVATGTAGVTGSITAATPSTLFGGGNFDQTTTNPGAGAQGGLMSAITTTPSIVVGSNSSLGSIAKPRSAGDIYVTGGTGSNVNLDGASTTTNEGANIVVNGNSVSFLVETISYQPNVTAFNASSSAQGSPNTVAFNVSIPSVSAYGAYQGSNYFVGVPSYPGLSSPGSSNTSMGYTSNSSGIRLNNAIPGDVNLDGTVNGTDLAIINSSLNATGVTGGYTAGDLNDDTIINGTDLAIVNSNLNAVEGPSPTGVFADPTAAIGDAGSGSVPEPTSLGLIVVGGMMALRRRRSPN